MFLDDPEQVYLIFISIVFGVFFAVWIVPISKAYHDSAKEDVNSTLTTLRTRSMAKGGVMFIMLVCLWWWYGTFMGRVAPANGFWAYLYDFITLCSFAVAFQMWSHRTVFPMVVFVAAALMLGRFGFAYSIIEDGSDAQTAIQVAFVILVIFMLAAVSAVVGAAVATNASGSNGSYRQGLQTIWPAVDRGTLYLLILGIIVTFAAVLITEGPPFSVPVKSKVWMKAQPVVGEETKTKKAIGEIK